MLAALVPLESAARGSAAELPGLGRPSTAAEARCGEVMPVARLICAMPVTWTTSSLSRCVAVPLVLLPVIAKTPSPFEARPPDIQMASPRPPVAQPAA
jgi:hypothetical protein